MNPMLEKQYIITEQTLSFLEDIQEILLEYASGEPSTEPEVLQTIGRMGGILDTIRYNDFDGDEEDELFPDSVPYLKQELKEADDYIDKLQNSPKSNGSYHDERVFQDGFQSGWKEALEVLENRLTGESNSSAEPRENPQKEPAGTKDSTSPQFATDYKVNPGMQPKVDFMGQPVQNPYDDVILSHDGKWECVDPVEGEWKRIDAEDKTTFPDQAEDSADS